MQGACSMGVTHVRQESAGAAGGWGRASAQRAQCLAVSQIAVAGMHRGGRCVHHGACMLAARQRSRCRRGGGVLLRGPRVWQAPAGRWQETTVRAGLITAGRGAGAGMGAAAYADAGVGSRAGWRAAALRRAPTSSAAQGRFFMKMVRLPLAADTSTALPSAAFFFLAAGFASSLPSSSCSDGQVSRQEQGQPGDGAAAAGNRPAGLPAPSPAMQKAHRAKDTHRGSPPRPAPRPSSPPPQTPPPPQRTPPWPCRRRRASRPAWASLQAARGRSRASSKGGRAGRPTAAAAAAAVEVRAASGCSVYGW